MVGKNPHRPEGKADTDNEHMQASWMNSGMPHNSPKNEMRRHEEDVARIGQPSQFPAEEQFGGSRPGVESRVKEAIARREDREGEEEE